MKITINMNATEYNGIGHLISNISDEFGVSSSVGKFAPFDMLENSETSSNGVCTSIQVTDSYVTAEIACRPAYTKDVTVLALKLAMMVAPIYASCKGLLGLIKVVRSSVENTVKEFTSAHETPVVSACLEVYPDGETGPRAYAQVIKNDESYCVHKVMLDGHFSVEKAEALIAISKLKAMENAAYIGAFSEYKNMTDAEADFDKVVEAQRKYYNTSKATQKTAEKEN